MPLEIHEVVNDADFAEIIPVEWTSYETPFNGFFPLYVPNRPAEPKARNEAMQESIHRQTEWHRGDPRSRWLKVVDTESGKVIAAAQWFIYKENPFAIPPKEPLEAYWWPEGEGRKFANMALGQLIAPRLERMVKPHLLLEICFVHPEYRRRGAGSLLVGWGTRKADEMGLEAFVQATTDGKPLYEKHGFIMIDDFHIDPQVSEPSEEWERLRQKVRAPVVGHFMWRPVGGKYEPGRTKIPWAS